MKIFLASDHAGFELKEFVKKMLLRKGYEVRDFGTFTPKQCDYPDYIIPACRAIAKTRGGRGIVFGGSGIGECIAANKVKGIRAAIAYDEYTAKITREHNDSNVLCLGGRTRTKSRALAQKIVLLWLKTPFSGESRHKRRLHKITLFEDSQ